MTTKRPVVTVALEGKTDVPIVERVLNLVGFDLGTIYGQKGKDHLDLHLGGYNKAARFAHWLALRDLDQDAACAPELHRRLLPTVERFMCLRIAVHAGESWLLADRARFASFMGVSTDRLAQDPDSILDPKGFVVSLARQSRKRDIREDILPRDGSRARIGPGYTSRITEFARDAWRPTVAAERSPSLAGCLNALRRWKD